MSRHQIFLIITVLILFSSITFGQIGLLNIVPIDSIQIQFSQDWLGDLKLFDVNNDNIKDIFVGNNNGLFLFNGATRNLLWADTTNIGAVRSIEVGDIEPDGLYDYIVGSVYDNRHHLSFQYGNNPGVWLEWPGITAGLISNLYLFRRNNVPFLDFTIDDGYQINLEDWTFFRVPDIFFTYKNAYNNGSVFVRVYGYGEEYDYHSLATKEHDFDFNLLYENTFLTCAWEEWIVFAYAFGEFGYEAEAFYHAHCDEYNNTLQLTKASIGFGEIDQMSFPEYLEPCYFRAVDFYTDDFDELIMKAVHEGSNKMVAFNSDMEVIAHSSPGIWMEAVEAIDIDNDGFEEIIFKRGGYMVFAKLIIEQTKIDETRYLPESYSITAHPNPFNSHLNLGLNCDVKGKLNIEVFDILGKNVTCIFKGEIPAGTHSFNWSPSEVNLSTGVYLIKSDFNDIVKMERVVYLK